MSIEEIVQRGYDYLERFYSDEEVVEPEKEPKRAPIEKKKRRPYFASPKKPSMRGKIKTFREDFVCIICGKTGRKNASRQKIHKECLPAYYKMKNAYWYARIKERDAKRLQNLIDTKEADYHLQKQCG